MTENMDSTGICLFKCFGQPAVNGLCRSYFDWIYSVYFSVCTLIYIHGNDYSVMLLLFTAFSGRSKAKQFRKANPTSTQEDPDKSWCHWEILLSGLLTIHGIEIRGSSGNSSCSCLPHVDVA